MAGILMIFVLSSVLAVNAAIESSRVFDGFRDAMSALCRELEPAVDQNERVTMDCDTGEITFREGEGFGFNDPELPLALGKDLREFMPRWLEAVTRDAYWDRVDAIEVAGYADKALKEGANLLFGNVDISTRRALSVMAFLVEDDREWFVGRPRDRLIERGTVAGYGPGGKDYPASCIGDNECPEARRVVIRASVDTSNVLAEVLRVLGGTGS
jgi:outer membrane protein OmpA-like peptidoglycan-associated protein